MKKRFKKTILGTLLVAAVFILPFINKEGVEKVKAEGQNCTSHSNYYMFSLVADITSYDKLSLPGTRTHTSYFRDDIPEGTDLDSAKYEWLDLKSGQDGWTIEKYWDEYFKTQEEGDKNENGLLYKNGNEWYFYHAKEWVNDEAGEESEGHIDPGKYNREYVIKNTYYNSATDGIFKFKLTETTNSPRPASVKRTIGTDWTAFKEEVRAQYNAGVHPTERHIWLPAVLKVTFDVCEGETIIPEDSHTVTLKYVDDKTNEEIKNQLNVGRYKKGETYTASCLQKIDDYKLVSERELSGTMADKDEVLYCRYSKDTDTGYKVTVNYLDKNTKKSIKDPYTYPNTYKNGEKYSASCLDSIGNDYILDSYSGSLNGTINNKDVVINCLYTTQPVQTSDIPIYIVWAVGGAALVYSIYYFRKYYKQQNKA